MVQYSTLHLDMIQTAGVGALALIVGMILTRKVAFLQKFCVPSPVSGGIIFSLLTLALYGWFHVDMGAGTLLSWLLAKTGVTFPTYFGALILAAIVRNTIGLFSYKDDGKWVKADKLLDMERIISVGNICLSLFLGMAMISLKLWELQSLALPLIIILVFQVAMMDFFAYFVAFPLLGRNYDAAVLCAGICGFGLGATPNAMANMSAVCYKYRYAVKPFLIVPIIGAMFADLINTGIITFFLNIL